LPFRLPPTVPQFTPSGTHACQWTEIALQSEDLKTITKGGVASIEGGLDVVGAMQRIIYRELYITIIV
jgi:hypothetical protein